MSYEIYKRVHSEDEYFSKWDEDRLQELDEDLRNQIYRRYTIKCQVFQRDRCKCVNEKCSGKDNKLEMHHILFQCEGGEDDMDNCVVLCNTCHKLYHSGKGAVYIRGEEYKASNFEQMRQRQNKLKMRQFRKELKYLRPDYFGQKVPVELLLMLLKFLNTDYSRYCE